MTTAIRKRLATLEASLPPEPTPLPAYLLDPLRNFLSGFLAQPEIDLLREKLMTAYQLLPSPRALCDLTAMELELLEQYLVQVVDEKTGL